MGMQSVQMVNMSNNQNAQDVPVTSNMMAIPVDNSKTDYNQFGNTSVMGNTNAGASQLIDNSVNGVPANSLLPETPSDSPVSGFAGMRPKSGPTRGHLLPCHGMYPGCSFPFPGSK